MRVFIPLQVAPMMKVEPASWISVPVLVAGRPNARTIDADPLVDANCSGTVTELRTGRGIMNIRKQMGKSMERVARAPLKQRSRPAVTGITEDAQSQLNL